MKKIQMLRDQISLYQLKFLEMTISFHTTKPYKRNLGDLMLTFAQLESKIKG